MTIYTIGHSNYPVEWLIQMLRNYNIDTVVDIRGTPYSKYNIQYNKEVIEKTLKSEGFIYIYMASELAAKRINKSSYNEYGYADFEKVINEREFINGIVRLKKGCAMGYNIVLLGAMQDPIRCHRSILCGRELRKSEFNVLHILDDCSTCSQEEIEIRILDKYFPDRAQLTIDYLVGNEITEREMINEAYRKANKEIGYRIENIKK